MEKKRSVGVTVLGWSMFISGLFNLIQAIFLRMHRVSPFVGLGFYIFLLGFSILLIVAGLGFLLLRNWSRIIFIFIFSACVLFFGGHILYSSVKFPHQISGTWPLIVLPLLCGLVVYYLTRPKVKRQFVGDEGAKP